MLYGIGRSKIEHSILDKKISIMKKNLEKYGMKTPKPTTQDRWKVANNPKKNNYSKIVKTGRMRKKRSKQKKAAPKKTPEQLKIESFFTEAGLSHLSQIFMNNGFDELELVYEVETDHLIDMEISVEDQQRLLDAIFKKKKEKEKFQSILDRVSRSRNSNREKETVIPEEFDRGADSLQDSFRSKKGETKSEAVSSQKNSSFRIKKPVESTEETQASMFIISSETIANRKKAIQKSRQQEKQLQTASTANPETSEYQKISCWTCYKLFYMPKDELARKTALGVKKHYCSNACAEKDLKVSISTCNTCGKRFPTSRALRFDGKVYCSEECRPHLRQVASKLKTFIKKKGVEGQEVKTIIQMYELEEETSEMLGGGGGKDLDRDESPQRRRMRATSGSILKKSRSKSRNQKRVSFDSGTVFDRPPSAVGSRLSSGGIAKGGGGEEAGRQVRMIQNQIREQLAKKGGEGNPNLGKNQEKVGFLGKIENKKKVIWGAHGDGSANIHGSQGLNGAPGHKNRSKLDSIQVENDPIKSTSNLQIKTKAAMNSKIALQGRVIGKRKSPHSTNEIDFFVSKNPAMNPIRGKNSSRSKQRPPKPGQIGVNNLIKINKVQLGIKGTKEQIQSQRGALSSNTSRDKSKGLQGIIKPGTASIQKMIKQRNRFLKSNQSKRSQMIKVQRRTSNGRVSQNSSQITPSNAGQGTPRTGFQSNKVKTGFLKKGRRASRDGLIQRNRQSPEKPGHHKNLPSNNRNNKDNQNLQKIENEAKVEILERSDGEEEMEIESARNNPKYSTGYSFKYNAHEGGFEKPKRQTEDYFYLKNLKNKQKTSKEAEEEEMLNFKEYKRRDIQAKDIQPWDITDDDFDGLCSYSKDLDDEGEEEAGEGQNLAGEGSLDSESGESEDDEGDYAEDRLQSVDC